MFKRNKNGSGKVTAETEVKRVEEMVNYPGSEEVIDGPVDITGDVPGEYGKDGQLEELPDEAFDEYGRIDDPDEVMPGAEEESVDKEEDDAEDEVRVAEDDIDNSVIVRVGVNEVIKALKVAERDVVNRLKKKVGKHIDRSFLVEVLQSRGCSVEVAGILADKGLVVYKGKRLTTHMCKEIFNAMIR